ncbi:hypothetical protein CEXT_593581 [Caerostris extrusa]|uniref:Uncharacterized protein n=1 Tax=Caerostris extrusa TaxID=172846 RepID=A0AAV4PZ36_CAEEX|nr:hypothetical protein CEXT_593581 [Caerostris extrusa]
MQDGENGQNSLSCHLRSGEKEVETLSCLPAADTRVMWKLYLQRYAAASFFLNLSLSLIAPTYPAIYPLSSVIESLPMWYILNNETPSECCLFTKT